MAVFDRLAFARHGIGGGGRTGRYGRGGWVVEMGQPGLQAGRQQYAGAKQQDGANSRQSGFHCKTLQRNRVNAGTKPVFWQCATAGERYKRSTRERWREGGREVSAVGARRRRIPFSQSGGDKTAAGVTARAGPAG